MELMAKNKYGFDRNTDPDYWRKTSQAIWRDSSLTPDQKMAAQEKLVQQYQIEKREPKTILQNQPPSRNQNIKNKLGLSQSVSPSRVIDEIMRLSVKPDKTWKNLGLNKQQVLKQYGVVDMDADTKKKLALPLTASKSRVVAELKRLRRAPDDAWVQRGLNKKQVLRLYGIAG